MSLVDDERCYLVGQNDQLTFSIPTYIERESVCGPLSQIARLILYGCKSQDIL
jgi:hypothetical protein